MLEERKNLLFEYCTIRRVTEIIEDFTKYKYKENMDIHNQITEIPKIFEKYQF